MASLVDFSAVGSGCRKIHSFLEDDDEFGRLAALSVLSDPGMNLVR